MLVQSSPCSLLVFFNPFHTAAAFYLLNSLFFYVENTVRRGGTFAPKEKQKRLIQWEAE
ncbi:MAG: hypothetical protein ACYS17_09600 [Planctomycetota bacterium]|jgi:hypothetical protein